MDLAAPILFAVVTWWASTGIVLWLINRPRRTHRKIALGATVVLALATVGVVLLRETVTPMAAYTGFALGIASWAWHEVMFLLGFISGPRKSPCPEGLGLGRRFCVSAQTVIHHEVAIALHALVLLTLSIGAANQVALLTFAVLWAMRISAKLVVFFGAPNVASHFLPEHLRYLGSYFSKSSNAAAAVVALLATSGLALTVGAQIDGTAAGSFQQIGAILVTALAGLAVLEHLALVISLPDQILWSWAVKPNPKRPVGSPSP